MALNTLVESPISDSDNMNKSGDISLSSSTGTIPRKNTNESLPKKRRSINPSASSMNNEILAVLAVPMKTAHHFSFQGGGVLNADSVNFVYFHRLRRCAFWCCIISFLFDIGLGLTAFINCVRSKTFVGFSYSVDTLMDSVCTGFVSWHLMTASVSDMHRRDRLACCVIGALFIGSFLAIESRAIQSMLLANATPPDTTVLVYSLIHIIVFTVFSIIKIFISKQIKSTALMADSLNSIIGLIMSFPLLFWDRFTFLNKFGHLDDLVQVLMALFLFVVGWKLILDSITTMNAEYARNLREEKLRRMLREHNEEIDVDFEAVDAENPHISIAPIAGTRRFSIISNREIK
jgi:divalent metal cation (Fe/Co/Zn/Cd) transporter